MLASCVPVRGTDPRVLRNLIGAWHMWCLVRYRDPDRFLGLDSALRRICKVSHLSAVWVWWD